MSYSWISLEVKVIFAFPPRTSSTQSVCNKWTPDMRGRKHPRMPLGTHSLSRTTTLCGVVDEPFKKCAGRERKLGKKRMKKELKGGEEQV